MLYKFKENKNVKRNLKKIIFTNIIFYFIDFQAFKFL